MRSLGPIKNWELKDSHSWGNLKGRRNVVSFMKHPSTLIPCHLLSPIGWLKSTGKVKVKVKSLNHFWPFATPWTVAYQVSSIHEIFQARILEWVAIFFSRRSSRTRDWTQVSLIAGRFLTVWTTRDIPYQLYKSSLKIQIITMMFLGNHGFSYA